MEKRGSARRFKASAPLREVYATYQGLKMRMWDIRYEDILKFCKILKRTNCPLKQIVCLRVEGEITFVGIWYDTIMKWILGKQFLCSWNGYTWFCIVSSEGFSESGNQLPGCLKDPALLGRLNDGLQKEFLRHWFNWLNTCKIKCLITAVGFESPQSWVNFIFEVLNYIDV